MLPLQKNTLWNRTCMEQMTKVYFSVLLTYNNVADRLLVVGFMENSVALVQVSLLVLRFPLLVSFL